MFAELETARLNVENKNRSNLFSWRGQFTPQFVDYLLETYARPGQRVLDPFCGSGTVLQEAASHRLAVTGLEINPAAYAMAKFFSLSGLGHRSRSKVVKDASEILCSVTTRIDKGLPLFRNVSDYRENVSNLLGVAKQVLSTAEDKQTKLLLLLSLFRAEGSKNGNLAATLIRGFQFLSDQLMRLPVTEEAPVAALSDARSAHLLLNQQADVIITSPPYINVFNYHQNYRALLELVGFDMLKVAHSEIGSNRKNRGNRFLTVIQYCLDLELAINSFAKALVPDGLLIMVLGRESRVRGIPFGNSAIAEALIERSGVYSKSVSHERVFVNRFGQSIFEDILIAQRTGETIIGESARDVAKSELYNALGKAVGDVQANIEEALGLVGSIQPSPTFSKTALI
jgi:SAM-dependent methyltransferase